MWIKNAPDCIKSKLAKVGLIAVHKPKTCQCLWDAFLKQKQDVKKGTIYLYRDCQKHFFTTFSPSEPIENITSDRLLELKTTLLKRYAKASVTLYLTLIKAILNWAVRQDWLPKSPAQNIVAGS